MTKSVNWMAVEGARRRGKYGRMHPGDQELCQRAFNEDPKRYAQMSSRVVDEVIREVRLDPPKEEGSSLPLKTE